MFKLCPTRIDVFFSFYLLIYLFIFGCVGSSLLCSGFLQQWRVGATLCCGAQASHCHGFLLLWSTGSRRTGFSSCGTWTQQLWAVGSRAQAQQMLRTGFLAPWHVGSSRARAQTCVPCIGRQILNHCATREAPEQMLLNSQCVQLRPQRAHRVGFNQPWNKALLCLKPNKAQTNP